MDDSNFENVLLVYTRDMSGARLKLYILDMFVSEHLKKKLNKSFRITDCKTQSTLPFNISSQR